MNGKISDRAVSKSGNCQTVYYSKREAPQKPTLLGSTARPSTKVKWETGSTYKGDWKDNQKHGYGIQISTERHRYEGEWAHGVRHGHGTYWVKDKPVGGEEPKSSLRRSMTSDAEKRNPKNTVPNDVMLLRKVYTGDWKDDKRDGLGVAHYRDGSRYEGEWRANMREGQGTLFCANGDTYVGAWFADLQNGFGTLTKANRDVYEGQFVGGKREGAGLYYYRAKEKIFDGEWADDQPRVGVLIAAADFFAQDERGADLAAELELELDAQDEAESRTQAPRVETTTNTCIPRELRLSGDAPAMGPSARRRQFQLRYRPVPHLGLEAPDEVLGLEIARVQAERQAVRSLPFLDVEAIFGPEALDGIRLVFAQFDQRRRADLKPDVLKPHAVDEGEAFVRHTDLCALLLELGYTVGPTDAASLCRAVNQEWAPGARLVLADVVRVVYLCDVMQTLRAQGAAEAEQQQSVEVGDELHFNQDE